MILHFPSYLKRRTVWEEFFPFPAKYSECLLIPEGLILESLANINILNLLDDVMYTLVLQYYERKVDKRKKDNPILRDKKMKKLSVTIMITADGKEAVFLIKL